jgi:hypothetical protein
MSYRCLEEASRPGVVFRDGPTGRRAALAAGPDVWELMATLKSAPSRGEEAIATTAELLNLSESEVRTGVCYYADFPEEIDERIARNVEDAGESEAAWRRPAGPLAFGAVAAHPLAGRPRAHSGGLGRRRVSATPSSSTRRTIRLRPFGPRGALPCSFIRCPPWVWVASAPPASKEARMNHVLRNYS